MMTYSREYVLAPYLIIKKCSFLTGAVQPLDPIVRRSFGARAKLAFISMLTDCLINQASV